MEQIIFYIIILNFILLIFTKNKNYKTILWLLQVFNVLILIIPFINTYFDLNLIEKIYKFIIVIIIFCIGLLLNDSKIKHTIFTTAIMYLTLRIIDQYKIVDLNSNISENVLLIFIGVHLLKRIKGLSKIIVAFILLTIPNLIVTNSVYAKNLEFENLINDLNINVKNTIIEKDYINDSIYNEKIVIGEFTVYLCDELIEKESFKCNKDLIFLKNNENINVDFFEQDKVVYVPKINLYYSNTYKKVLTYLKKKLSIESINTYKVPFNFQDVLVLNILIWLTLLLNNNFLNVQKKIQHSLQNYKYKIIVSVFFVIVISTFSIHLNQKYKNYLFFKKIYNNSNLSNQNFKIIIQNDLSYINNLTEQDSFYINFSKESLQELLKYEGSINKLITSNPSNTIFIPKTNEDIQNIKIKIEIKCESIDNILNSNKSLNLNTFYYYNSMLEHEYPISQKKEIFNRIPCYLNNQILEVELNDYKIYGNSSKIIHFSNRENYIIKEIKLFSEDRKEINFYYLKNSGKNPDNSLNFYDVNFVDNIEIDSAKISFLNFYISILYSYLNMYR